MNLGSGATQTLVQLASMGSADWGLVSVANEEPTDLMLSGTSVDENAAAGAVVGSLSSSDPNSGESFSYSLVSGAGDTDNASFTIEGDVLKTLASFDHETKPSCSVRVRTTDQGGLKHERAFTVTVSNVSPEVFQVTTADDSGPGSVREAIVRANGCGDSAEVVFVNSLGTITLESPLPAITVPVRVDCGTGNTLNQGFSVSGGGSVAITGDEGAIGGSTTIANGTLTIADGSLGASQVTVQSDGTLRGNGAVGGLIVGAGGHVAPGTSPGTINSGDTIWSSGRCHRVHCRRLSRHGRRCERTGRRDLWSLCRGE